MTSYEKLKYVIKKLLKFESIYPNSDEFEDIGITYDNYRRIITKLNQSKIIRPISKGEQKLTHNLIDNKYFNNSEINASLLTSIIHPEKEINKSKTIKYIFTSVPDKINFMHKYNFSDKFNESLDCLLSLDEKISYFSQIIEINKEEKKNICKIKTIDKKELLIVPLESFIFENSWYLCFYNIQIDELEIICTKSIIYSNLVEDLFFKYINRKDIEKKIDEFVVNFHEINSYVIKINIETLSLLIDLKLIEKFSIYEEREKKFNDYVSKSSVLKNYKPFINQDFIEEYDPRATIMNKETFLRYEKRRLKELEKKRQKKIEKDKFKNEFQLKKQPNIILKKRLYKINLNLISECIFFKEQYFDSNEKTYFVKIQTSKVKFDYIKHTFKVEIVDMNLYRI